MYQEIQEPIYLINDCWVLFGTYGLGNKLYSDMLLYISINFKSVLGVSVGLGKPALCVNYLKHLTGHG